MHFFWCNRFIFNFEIPKFDFCPLTSQSHGPDPEMYHQLECTGH